MIFHVYVKLPEDINEFTQLKVALVALVSFHAMGINDGSKRVRWRRSLTCLQAINRIGPHPAFAK